MSLEDDTRTLSALAQPTRLRIVAVLAEAGEAGMPAGVIAEEVGVPRNLMSAHLAVLSAADLVVSNRAGRYVTYVLRAETLTRCAAFLARLAQGTSGDDPGRR